MQLLFLGIVFLTIIGILAFKHPLYQAISGGMLAAVFLFHIPISIALKCLILPFTKISSVSVLLSLYLITFLQRILEARGQLLKAQRDLYGIFNDQRINTVGSCLFIGLLPSAACMILCSDLVGETTSEYLTKEEQAFTASWFRHIPESVLPTYSAVLLMLSLADVEIADFLIFMAVPVFCLGLIGFMSGLRKLPLCAGKNADVSKMSSASDLLKHIWSLLLLLLLMIGFRLDIITAVSVTIAVSIIIYRVNITEIRKFAKNACEITLILNTYLVLVLKELIEYTDVIETIPGTLEILPLPEYMVFAAVLFIVTIISGSTAAIAMVIPLTFSVLRGGIPLAVFFMCITHAASQLSPTHICLVVAAERFRISLGSLIRKTCVPSVIFIILMTLYYNILVMLRIA